MAKDKLWTASVRTGALMLQAQCKSSKAELMRRLLADDPLWKRATVTLSMAPRLANRYFRRGLAMRCIRGDA